MKEKLKNAIFNLVSICWFVFMMLPMILLVIFVPMMLFSDINVIRTSGFSGENIGIVFCAFISFIVAITMLVPCFRKCFKKLPWLYPLIIIFLIDTFILSIGITILNYGYEIQNETRHTLFYVLMIIQLVISRIIMCIYFKHKPIKYYEESVLNE